jgi:hypothetical protein
VRLSRQFAEAVLAWRKQPSRARHDAVHYFRDEATQSDDWARHEQQMGRESGDEYRRHREDAAAMRAALGVLKAAASVSSKKRRG